jgi:hypothetical protein
VWSGSSVTLVQNGVDADYRFGDSSMGWFFWPANQIDRLVRPGTWD